MQNLIPYVHRLLTRVSLRTTLSFWIYAAFPSGPCYNKMDLFKYKQLYCQPSISALLYSYAYVPIKMQVSLNNQKRKEKLIKTLTDL